MHSIRNCLTTAFVLILSSGGVPALQAQPIEQNASAGGEPASVDITLELVREMDEAEAIGQLYGEFASVASASGYEVSFALGGFQTYEHDSFDDLYWLNLFSPPTGSWIQTTPLTARDRPYGQERIGLIMAWRDVLDEGGASAFLQLEATTKADDAFRRVKADRESFTLPAAITAFDVEVAFEGRVSSYRATALWTPATTNSVAIVLVDHFVPDVVKALTFVRGRQVHDVEDLLNPSDRFPDLDEAAGMCIDDPPFSQVLPSLDSGVRRQEHVTGHHRARLVTRQTCDTRSNCTSTCQLSSFAPSGCTEFGLLVRSEQRIAVHRLHESIESRNDASQGISECVFGLGCAIESCALGLCDADVSFDFKILGSGLSYGTNDTTRGVTDLSLTQSADCPAARRIAAPDPPPAPPPSGPIEPPPPSPPPPPPPTRRCELVRIELGCPPPPCDDVLFELRCL